MLGVISKHANLHQIVDDDAIMFMTDLVNGYKEIHVFVDHPVDELVEAKVGDIEPLDVREPGAEHVGPKVDNAQALDVLDPKVIVDDHVGYAGYYEDEVYSDGNESDHYHDHTQYEYDDHYNYDFHDYDDEYVLVNDDYKHGFLEYGGHDNDDHNNPIEVDAKQVYSRRASKEPMTEYQQQDQLTTQQRRVMRLGEMTQKRNQNCIQLE